MDASIATRRSHVLTPLALALLTAFPHGSAVAGDACDSVRNCQGDQLQGVAFSAPPGTLNVFNIAGDGIRPGLGIAGISLTGSAGQSLRISSGSGSELVRIVTDGAPGISVFSQGRPAAAAQPDALLGVRLPDATGLSGSGVTVDSRSDITTQGAGAHGILARSITSGADATATAGLDAFTNAGITFRVTRANGTTAVTAAADVTVDARIAEFTLLANGQLVFGNTYGDVRGQAIFRTDGTVDFSVDQAYFQANLQANDKRVVAVPLLVDGLRNGSTVRPGLQAYLLAQISKDANGVLTVSTSTFYPDFGLSNRLAGERLPWPDLTAYVARLRTQANAAGGSGGDVTVNHLAGTIVTQGAAAHGIYALSQGARGYDGDNGGDWWTIGFDEPDAGTAGYRAGKVSVQVNGVIDIRHRTATDVASASVGVLARSSGGDGGTGGWGGTYYGGRLGGDGGGGGSVTVTGNGSITTLDPWGSGILAISEGGNGGQGGGAQFVTDGAAGGAGGKGGQVEVRGNWTIDTTGHDAHGIWAKSVAGTAGAGGSGGWAAGEPAGGGLADDGGDVILVSGGTITTRGDDAFALFGQSVGGFGGSGGAGGSIFYSRGGSGSSAGSGGVVRVTNEATGVLVTGGVASHALMAQSVGGGGGAGGAGAGIVALGGSGAEGGNGGDVFATNAGSITTTGQDARGIYAQSVGGQGGDGGSASGIGAVGGGASGSSDGGDVSVTNSGTIRTGGVGANAIFAQSIGGGGGSGGSSSGWFAVGGTAGGGGPGGAVSVTHSGELLQTTKADASAIYAQSVGGGGGKGGNAAAVGAFVAVAVGGQGGTGGQADKVTVVTSAGSRIVTGGARSQGIFAQSVGGGGGSGGFSAAVSAGVGASATVTIGGNGGSGGDAGEVEVHNASLIHTVGEDATGVFAESVGGGGGNGGFAIGGALSDQIALTFAFGGQGAGGGLGQKVTVGNSAGILTEGARAVGLQAQSVGGGGGNGGFTVTASGGGLGALGLNLGGKAGGGNSAGVVEVSNTGAIATLGEDAHALLAQSVGGGGGNGGFSVNAAFGGTAAGTIALGGTGGAGSAGNLVTVTNTAGLATGGERAVGLFAQSVGGGGGNGGFSIAVSGGGAGAGAISLGGSGSNGGNADEVHVDNQADISTQGRDAHGLFAQSLGGGGGNGGFSVAVSGAGIGSGSISIGGDGAGGGVSDLVDVYQRGRITTQGANAVGLFAQSVGGGGGNGGLSISAAGAGTGAGSFALGGNGSTGGDGARVDVDTGGAIETHGREAHGLFAQSLGGGGGNGGFSLTATGAGTGAGSLSIGGRAGGGGDGKDVWVLQRGSVDTWGDGAIGLFAQSVGGGGGNGGFSIALSGAGTGAGSLGLGGKGAGGGDGDTVQVDSDGAIATRGREAHGLLAQSVGGGGGNGGFSITGSGAGTGSGSVTIGGQAGGGGSGKQVSVFQAGSIDTWGEGAIGLFAQSVGGGGGNGGFSIALSGAGTGSGTLALGGSGAGGGNGGIVYVDSDGTLSTTGAKAHGLLAQSVGGGGGNGGFSVAAAGGGQGGGSVSIGGRGAGGGNGEAVTVLSGGRIDTDGDGAVGLFAQSVGGGGGNGGLAAAAALGGKYTLAMGFGGDAGQGGGGGTVHLDSSSHIVARGEGAHAILAQSIGGGGGNGGLSVTLGVNAPKTGNGAEIGVSVGGLGGGGGIGGDVTVGHERALGGTLVTLGDSAHGIFAQSVGGGGGNGGSAVSLSFSADGKMDKNAKTLTASVAVAGNGGTGNIGGTVQVNNAATIDTVGGDSHGILAQSIGGGGGTGGSAKSIGLSTTSLLPLKDSEGTRLGLKIEMSGDGGNGNRGGEVSVVNSGAIQTRGAYSRGIFAQSVGGGGGTAAQGVLGAVGDWLDAGQSVLDGLGLAKTLYDAFKEGGDPSGLIPTSLSIKLGADKGSGADAARVHVGNTADITTLGFGSHGVFAQSIGGGGGDAKAFAEGRDVEDEQDVGTGIGLLGEFVIGGKGGAAGSGGVVEVLHNGRIGTAGDQAHAIYAQSVGGGGGQAGSVAGGFSGVDAIGLGFGFGQNGGSAGNGGAVTVNSTGTLVTEGERSIGILAQSVGGGGGAAGDRSGLAFFGSVGGSGSGGDVSVTHDGAIVTRGARAHGIFAQSAGGTASGAYAGRGGTVSVTLRGAGIEVSGADADAILAQSIGVNGGRDISVLVDGAWVQGGAGHGAGVRFLDGAANLLDNRGVVTSLGGIDGLAVAGTGGSESVRNAGLITGSVDLGAGANGFANLAGAALYSGSVLNLGTGNLLSNDGLLAPGGAGRRLSTTLTGNMVQGGSGVLDIDFDAMAQESDRIDVSGTAVLDGTVRMRVTNPTPADRRVTLVSAQGGASAAGLALVAQPSAVANYTLETEGKDVKLHYRIDFSNVRGLNANQSSVGGHVNDIQRAGGTAEFAPLAATLFALPEASDLAGAYDRLSPEPHGTLATTTALSSLQFSDAMLSCRVADGESRFVREGECNWLSAGASTLTQDKTFENLGFERKTYGISGGFQREVAAGWHAGAGIGIEHGVTHTGELASSRGDQLQAGAMLKGRRGDTTFSASLSGGRGGYDSQRAVDLPTGAVTALSSQRVVFLASHLRLAQLMDQGGWYLRPLVDLGATRVNRKGFVESGAGAANLIVGSQGETFTTLQPAIEFGAESRRADGALVRPFLRAGVLHLMSGASPTTQATLQGAPAGTDAFTVKGHIDRTLVELNAAVDVINPGGVVLRLGYAGQYASNIKRHSLMVKASMPF